MKDEEKPLVSVLVPSFNHEAWVTETILSIVNQTYDYTNIQLIVTDDCSTDNTAAILSKLAKTYDFKLRIHKKNIGLPSTLNEMISFTKGKYIVIIASDDIMVLDRIENQINILMQNPDIDILAGDFILINEHGNVLSQYTKIPQLSLINYSFDDLFLALKPRFGAGSAIFRSDLFQRIGGYESAYQVEDYFYWLKATYNKAKIVKCNLPFYYYRVHGKAISSNEELINSEVFKILAIYKDHPKYSKAILNREFYLMSKWIFMRKTKVIKHLINNPMLFLNRKIIQILIMLILPIDILKWKLPENYYRHATS